MIMLSDGMTCSVYSTSADGNYEVRYKSNVLLYPSGEVQWIPPAIYQSSCTIDVTYFPFDQQKCVMKFGSWTFNGDQVALKLYNDNAWVDLSDYWKSGTWDIVEVPAFLNVYNSTKNGRPTETDISFYITIRRKTLFYTVNLILPTLLISFLCILVFYLPAEAGEKITLGISILLSLVVFLLLVSKILPPTSLVVPLIAKYLLFTFLMNCISILATVMIINWNFRGPRTHKMPNWIRIVFLKYLPIILFIRRPKKTRFRWMMDMPSLGVHYHPYRQSQQQQQQQSSQQSSGAATAAAVTSVAAAINQQQQQSQPQQQRVPPNFSSDINKDYHAHKLNTASVRATDLDVGEGAMSSSIHAHSLSAHQQQQHHHHHVHHTTSTSSSSHHHHHHPNCTINSQQLMRKSSLDGACESSVPKDDEESIDTLYLTPEAYRATEAIEFIAEHLRSEDEYIQVIHLLGVFFFSFFFSLSLAFFCASASVSRLPAKKEAK